MIIDLKPYLAVKDSGVEWLGDVPEHWEIRKFRSVLRNVTSRNRPDLPLLSVVREKGVIVRDVSNRDENSNFIPDDLTNYKVVREGQFAMNKMKAWQGSYGVSLHDGIVSPAYYVFNINDVTGDFFNVAIRSKVYVPFFTQASDGVRIGQWDLSQHRMREITFSVPPLSEQAAIVRYLDHVNRRLRQLVGAKRKLISLLTEQKQAIIHHAVTRGLDPDVPLKDSGVEWLGEVPKHWEVSQVRAFAQVVRGGTPRPAGDPRFFQGDSEPWITVGELTKDDGMYLNRTAARLTHAGAERSRTIVPGTLLLTNSGATLGVPKITKIQGCINDGVAAFLRVNGSIVLSYLYFYWKTQTQHLLAWVSLGAQPNLNTQIIGGWPVVVPPPSEQVAIVAYLEEAVVGIEKTISRANREIELLNEYRNRLIADVVTGKLDVREAAAELPEVDPLDIEDDMDDMLDSDVETDLDAIPEKLSS